jgi:hypothetical protein
LARNYESNGPDVKVRGTAAHVAEKYMSLARDAHASGDLVTAESYFQYAEHYNRIVMAAQAQAGPQSHSGEGPNGGGFRPRWNAEPAEPAEPAAPVEESGSEIAAGGGDEIRSPQQGRDEPRERHGGNGAQASARENEDSDQPEAAQTDESGPTRAR